VGQDEKVFTNASFAYNIHTLALCSARGGIVGAEWPFNLP